MLLDVETDTTYIFDRAKGAIPNSYLRTVLKNCIVHKTNFQRNRGGRQRTYRLTIFELQDKQTQTFDDVIDVKISPHEQFISISHANKEKITLWNTETWKQERIIDNVYPHGEVAYSADGKFIIISSSNKVKKQRAVKIIPTAINGKHLFDYYDLIFEPLTKEEKIKYQID